MEEIAKSLAETAVQDSHIIQHPSPSGDIAPSTSADHAPISLLRDSLPSIQFSSSHADLHRLSQHQQQQSRHHRHEQDLGADETVSEISLEDSPGPTSPPKPTRPPLPPIPDLRFEQSYLKGLEAAKGSVLWMVIITIRDQVLFPGLQGFVWALGLAGIRTLRTRQAENGAAWGGWLRDYFDRLVRTDTTMMGNQRRR
jgi:hypothetical protein